MWLRRGNRWSFRAFIPELFVEAVRKLILGYLAGLDQIELNAVLIYRPIKRSARGLPGQESSGSRWSTLWIWQPAPERESHCAQRILFHYQINRLLRAVIDNGKNPDTSSIDQLTDYKTHRPDFIAPLGAMITPARFEAPSLLSTISFAATVYLAAYRCLAR